VPAAGVGHGAVATAVAEGGEQQLSQIDVVKVPELAGFAAFFVDAGKLPATNRLYGLFNYVTYIHMQPHKGQQQ
jgi:hypothetical protein